jgi:hypothetical protein
VYLLVASFSYVIPESVAILLSLRGVVDLTETITIRGRRYLRVSAAGLSLAWQAQEHFGGTAWARLPLRGRWGKYAAWRYLLWLQEQRQARAAEIEAQRRKDEARRAEIATGERAPLETSALDWRLDGRI